MSILLGIAYKEKRKGPMIECQDAILTIDQGLVGDHRGRPGKRQITLMTQKDWLQACNELAAELPWTDRRANLLVDELDLYKKIGHKISIGDVILEITGETDPCERMEEVKPGLFNALKPDWRGGVTCRVHHGGKIHIKQNVHIDET